MNEDTLPFFVYGTLLPGQPNAYLWHDSVTKIEAATLANGRLYDMGSYPMLVEEGEKRVVGRVIHIAEDEYAAVLARLDYLEGYDAEQPSEFGYRRVVREVRVAGLGRNGRSLRAWVYVGQQTAVWGMMPVPGGDWADYVVWQSSRGRDL